MTSPRRSPMRDAENSTPPLSPPAKTPSRPQNPAREDRPVASPLRSLVSSPAKTPSRPQTPAREDGPVAYPLRSPLRRAELPTPPRTPPDEPAPPPAVTIANRLTRDGVSPAEKEISEGGGGVRAREGGSVRGALGLRVAAFVLSMIAFSVMAADKTDGWAGDSFDRYKEFRYLVAVNVLAFAYSAFQVCEKIYRKICTRHIMSRRMGCYFDLSMDQILAYLLMSASSAAASRNDVWVSRFGSDGFTHKANASIAMSFLAFVALALSSLVSAYKLFGRSS